jgi:hypothetical protein
MFLLTRCKVNTREQMITTNQPVVLLQILFDSLPLIRVEPIPSSASNKPLVTTTLLQELHVLQNFSSADFDRKSLEP